MSRVLMALAGVVGASLVATSAQGQAVTVLGGGMARLCANAALAGESDARFEEYCTTALATEVLGPLDRAGTLVNRGVLKLRRKDFASAQKDFNSALDAKPDFGEAYVNRGAAFVGARRYAEGLSDINRALELGVQEPEKAFFNRALAFEKLGLRQAAYLDYSRAITLNPTWEQPRREIARFTEQTP